MANRFYLYRFPASDRPAFWEEIGHSLKISGVLFQGMGLSVLALSPSAEPNVSNLEILIPTVEEWSDLIQASDDPKYLDIDENGVVRAIHRKVRQAISGAIQQRIWVRDGLCCLFCGRKMGEVSLTVDHWIPLEQGGRNDATNYVSSCRMDNKRKGDMSPQDWCEQEGLDFDLLDAYVKSNGATEHSAQFLADLAQDSKRPNSNP